MELPEECGCGTINMVDWEALERRQLSPLQSAEGYTCRECGCWNVLFITSLSLDEKLKHLSGMRPAHPSFWYYFVKARKRAEQMRGNHGEIRL